MGIEQRLVVLQRNVDLKTFLKPTIEIDQMWIRVIQQRSARSEPNGDGDPPAEGLNKTLRRMLLPKRQQVRYLPPFAASPLQRRAESDLFSVFR